MIPRVKTEMSYPQKMFDTLHSLLPAIIGFAVTLASVLILNPVAKIIRLIDEPGGRKKHTGEIPLVGGIAMFIGFTVSALLSLYPVGQYRALFLGLFILVLVGILDDFKELPAKTRLLVQLIVLAIMSFWGNVYLQSFGDIVFVGNIELGVMSVIVTLFAGASLINAVNMTDGLDGLAGSLSLVSLSCMFILSNQLDAHVLDSQLIGVSAACLLGFLYFNYRFPNRTTAKIFMGDAGSLFLGFLMCWFSISLTQEPNAVARPVAMLWLLGIPLCDLMTVFIRRMKRKQSPFSPGRDHIHHLLLDLGFSVNQTVTIMTGLAALLGSIGVLGEIYELNESALFIAFILLYCIYLYCINYSSKISEELVNKKLRS